MEIKDEDVKVKMSVCPECGNPILCQAPEMSNSNQQTIGLKRIQYVHELDNLLTVLKG